MGALGRVDVCDDDRRRRARECFVDCPDESVGLVGSSGLDAEGAGHVGERRTGRREEEPLEVVRCRALGNRKLSEDAATRVFHDAQDEGCLETSDQCEGADIVKSRYVAQECHDDDVSREHAASADGPGNQPIDASQAALMQHTDPRRSRPSKSIQVPYREAIADDEDAAVGQSVGQESSQTGLGECVADRILIGRPRRRPARLSIRLHGVQEERGVAEHDAVGAGGGIGHAVGGEDHSSRAMARREGRGRRADLDSDIDVRERKGASLDPLRGGWVKPEPARRLGEQSKSRAFDEAGHAPSEWVRITVAGSRDDGSALRARDDVTQRIDARLRSDERWRKYPRCSPGEERLEVFLPGFASFAHGFQGLTKLGVDVNRSGDGRERGQYCMGSDAGHVRERRRVGRTEGQRSTHVMAVELFLIEGLVRTRVGQLPGAVGGHDQERDQCALRFEDRRVEMSARASRSREQYRRLAGDPGLAECHERGTSLVDDYVDRDVFFGCQRERQRRGARAGTHHGMPHAGAGKGTHEESRMRGVEIARFQASPDVSPSTPKMVRSFQSVSRSSRSGSDPATIPPPANTSAWSE